MVAYLDLAAFKLRSVMPESDITALNTRQPGWIDTKLEEASRFIDAQLAKRYAVPFATPPDTVKRWVARMVTFECYQRRGWDPTDQQAEQIKGDSDDAKLEIVKAADSVTGLYDLPLASGSSGISKGGPRVYSEASPYVWTDVQSETGRPEDRSGSGT